MQTQTELTPLQLEYIMDEMRGFPDELGGDYTDLSPDAKAAFHVSICGSGVNGLSVALRCQRARAALRTYAACAARCMRLHCDISSFNGSAVYMVLTFRVAQLLRQHCNESFLPFSRD